METLITTAKCKELEVNPIDGNFGFEHYKAIHKFIFEKRQSFVLNKSILTNKPPCFNVNFTKPSCDILFQKLCRSLDQLVPSLGLEIMVCALDAYQLS